MRNIIFTALLLIGAAVQAQNTKFEILKEFVSPTLVLKKENTNVYLPIKSIKKLAAMQADTTITLTKQNIEKALDLAKQYKTVFITVDNHTIVKIIDFNNTVYSGLWKVSAPMGKGYIQQKGILAETKDHVNKIIGKPRKYERKMFLWKEK